MVDHSNTYLVAYREAIKSGEIVAGHELIKQLDRLIEDLSNPDYIYDTKDAYNRIAFIEKFCKHTKSPYYGMPFILELWQKAFIEAFYSFKWSESGYRYYYEEEPQREHLRRFKKAILLVGRKNGKSTLCSGLTLTELMIGASGSDIVCSSNDDAQASIIFEETGIMREQFDPSGKRTHKNLKGIFNVKTKSKIFKLSDRTRNKEGRNIDGAVLDETNEMQNNIIAKSIDQSQSTKMEPWFINITTEGFVNDGYLDQELDYARKVLDGDVEDATLLSFLYTCDSESEVFQNEDSWQKANPSLGSIKKKKYLKDQIRKAQHDKSERIFMLAKDFNVKLNSSASWLMPDDVNNIETFNINDFRGCFAIGAVDLSKSGDLASARVFMMKSGSPVKYTLQKYFVPASKIESGELSKDEKETYLSWIREGLIEVSPGNENDFSLVTNWFVKLYKDYGVRAYKIGYDKWGSVYWIKEMEDIGFSCVRVDQNWGSMSEPMKLVEADLKSKLINYNNNPIDKYCLNNTALAINNKADIMPAKMKGKENLKIDGAVTMIIGYRVYIDNRSEFLRLVEGR